MKPGSQNGGCRGGLLCYECWKAWQRWNLTPNPCGQRGEAPDVCSDCEEAELARRFADAAERGTP